MEETTDCGRLKDTEGITSLDELLDRKYGREGELGRVRFEEEALAFRAAETPDGDK